MDVYFLKSFYQIGEQIKTIMDRILFIDEREEGVLPFIQVNKRRDFDKTMRGEGDKPKLMIFLFLES